jgi:hypothetical protein
MFNLLPPRHISTLPESGRIADIGGCLKCAKSRREQMQRRAVLFDHLVSAGEQRRWNVEAKSPRGLEINHEFKLSGLHDR